MSELHEEATKILNHPMMVKFFEDAKKRYHNIIESSEYEQDSVRTDAYLMLRATNNLESTLKEYVSLGEIKNPVVKRLKSLD